MRLRLVFLLFVSLSWFVFACKSSSKLDQNDSSVKWGLDYELDPDQGYIDLDSVVHRLYLLGVLPGEEICIDGDEGISSIFIKAVDDWAEIIGRKKHLIVKKNCNDQSDYRVALTVQNRGSYEEFCEISAIVNKKREYVKAFVQEDMSDLSSRGFGLHVCAPNDVNIENTIYHEVGHLWGLCDQYDLEQNGEELSLLHGHGKRCSTRGYRSSAVGNGYMTATPFYKKPIEGFSEDDKSGILSAASRDDLKANRIWKARLE